MKKLAYIFSAMMLVVFLFSTTVQAQWSTVGAGPSIYNTTLTGNLGIGTTAMNDLFHGYSAAGRAGLTLQSGYTGASLKTLGQFVGQAANGDQFIMAFRHNAGGYQDMLQSCYLATATPPAYAEFMYFRFDTQKWEMRKGVQIAEFQNSGAVYFNNNSAGVFGATSGLVGIGVTSMPSGVKLAVAGKVACKEVEVTLSYFPDYVFSSDYKLRSLYDVENFINTNKHLPDVPSATEVTSKGLNLGDMNATLLQKVEELTLYMIDLKKENDQLKARVQKLEK